MGKTLYTTETLHENMKKPNLFSIYSKNTEELPR